MRHRTERREKEEQMHASYMYNCLVKSKTGSRCVSMALDARLRRRYMFASA